jgi:hypothetical protein
MKPTAIDPSSVNHQKAMFVFCLAGFEIDHPPCLRTLPEMVLLQNSLRYLLEIQSFFLSPALMSKRLLLISELLVEPWAEPAQRKQTTEKEVQVVFQRNTNTGHKGGQTLNANYTRGCGTFTRAIPLSASFVVDLECQAERMRSTQTT